MGTAADLSDVCPTRVIETPEKALPSPLIVTVRFPSANSNWVIRYWLLPVPSPLPALKVPLTKGSSGTSVVAETPATAAAQAAGLPPVILAHSLNVKNTPSNAWDSFEAWSHEVIQS